MEGGIGCSVLAENVKKKLDEYYPSLGGEGLR
jgi:hypothetical protein